MRISLRSCNLSQRLVKIPWTIPHVFSYPRSAATVVVVRVNVCGRCKSEIGDKRWQTIPKYSSHILMILRNTRRWVSELGAKLYRKGVECNTRPVGPPVPAMIWHNSWSVVSEESDRVLVICTDNYLRKANAGEGGSWI